MDQLINETSSWPLSVEHRHQAIGYVLGLYVSARSQLLDLLCLHRCDRGVLGGPPILRSIFESVVTARWLLGVDQDPQGLVDRFIRFAQDSNRTVSLIADETGTIADRDFAALQRRRWEEYRPGVPFERQMPGLNERLLEPQQDWYPRYRRMSLLAHPTLQSAQRGIGEATGTFPAVDDVGVETVLAVAAMQVWLLATSIDLWNGGALVRRADCDEDWVGLGAAINEFTKA